MRNNRIPMERLKMNKTPITIWVTIEEPEIKDNKIVVKKGSFYYNNQKYLIENGDIKNENGNI